MLQPPLIVLMTDFGLEDAFVGVMKGVIATICREARVIDLTHSISAQNVRQAAFHLDRSVGYFPDGTIFVSVVDPGVGTARRAIGVEAGPYFFIAPDNGLLTPVFERWANAKCHELTKPTYQLANPSATFHGRDLFSPAAAHLATGVPLDAFGAAIDVANCTRIELWKNRPLEEGNGWQGEVIATDHFGNLITSFEASMIAGGEDWKVTVGNSAPLPIVRTYGEVKPGQPLAYIGSSGMIEIAIHNGNASAELEVGEGELVHLCKS
ncbi:SAM-dependent chlorinase/fluorinase [Chlorobaculum sp. MV4-Y]|jgi:S-adenosylmethionine hydrolase|uniref:SAM hydrolase/SAM-dependent halogenase family protein n=1 Tax=Chlorobaculum sp. MV4-Y TaxID=2976335 RepID=UPI0021AE3EFF|nr:SAM-dependent chlorinase/fluorinase [Chlorobaculum sp. MV4-Y]UWX56871.1 SAM-dependent chlorinase/fluorinase [Chlorobaculum sp. MV4-Y]